MSLNSGDDKKKGNTTKRQHLVAESYLEFFGTTEDRGKVWVFDKHDGAIFQTSVKNVSVETSFHAYVLGQANTSGVGQVAASAV